MTKTTQMFRAAMGIAIAGALGGTALAQQSIASFTGISYQQDFDNTGGSGNGGFGNALDFSATGTDYTTLPTGWVLSGSSGNYRSSTGSLSTADHYSYGSSTASAERALGGVSNSSSLIFGAIFENNTGRPLTQIYVQYTGEQWRHGSNNADRLDFSYSVNPTAGSVTTGTWTDINTLDFNAPVVAATPGSGTLGPRDGNVAPNRTTLGVLITLSSSVPIGGLFGIRWRNFDSPSTNGEDGLAVDDLIVMVPEAWQPAALAGVVLFGLAVWQRRRSLQSAV
jgi:hypothetical protein